MFNYDEIQKQLAAHHGIGPIKIGCDPELFLVDANGTPVSAIGMIGAGKDNPKQIDGWVDGFKLQEDNVAVEYNVPATENAYSFAYSVKNTRKHIADTIATPRGLRISTRASLQFGPDQLNNEAAQTFGCDPDFNVYDLAENPRPATRDKSLRSAGGHIHIGIPDGRNITDNQKVVLAQLLELYLGTQLAILDPDKRRMKLYGKAGAIRFKPYGFEYRTPSNLWSMLRPTTIQDLATTLFVLLNDSHFVRRFQPRYAMLARAAINTGNKKLLQEMWDSALFKDVTPTLLKRYVREEVAYVLKDGVLPNDMV